MRSSPIFALCILACLAPSLPGGESSVAQPYEKIRYPHFKDSRLYMLLEADQAEAYELSAGTPRVNLQNIAITIYEDDKEILKDVPGDVEPPVRTTIVSKRGHFTRRSPEPGMGAEDIVILEGDVVVRQFRAPDAPPPPPGLRPSRMPAGVETEIRCQHAQWNWSLLKLNGDGDVELVQEDFRITGTGFLYLADSEVVESGESRKDPKAWGGIFFIEHNARMEIDRPVDGGAHDRTAITCRDTASYKLREKEVQFEREVRVARSGLTIDCDILKVFLRTEEDPAPERKDGPTPLPGMVKSIVATIGSRLGAVVITGYEVDWRGQNGEIVYVARGGRADFAYDEGLISLADSRTDRTPEVEFGMDRISDRVLDFVLRREDGDSGADAPGLSSLRTRGGQGRVILRPRQGATGEAAKLTQIDYQGEMRYESAENLIRFTESVHLSQESFSIRSGLLDVRLRGAEGLSLSGDARESAGQRVGRVVAEDNVVIDLPGRQGSERRQASAHRAEYEADDSKDLATLRLFGPPSHTPPHPWITDDLGNRISAPTIVMQRLSGNRVRPRHLLQAFDGTITCDFVTKADDIAVRNKVISVKCEELLEFNEEKGVAWFTGDVQAASDAPEDNYVLTSDMLVIYLTEKPDPNDPENVIIRPRRVDANGRAVLRQDARVCEAEQIIRDFPTERMDEGDIYLEGFPGDGVAPPKMAVYREQEGETVLSLFMAPRIKASAKGNLVQANGPGHLSMPDAQPGMRSEIEFAGAARYESFQGGVMSEAKFRRGVAMRQPSRDLVISADEVDATFYQDSVEAPANDDPAGAAIERIGKLRRTEARTGVRIEHGLPRKGRRIATGDKGVVEFTSTGNVITLTVDRRLGEQRWVMARDHDGLTLWSTQIEVRDSQGVTRAAGPGELQIPGDPDSDGLNKIPTRIAYGERGFLVYNELALNIRAEDNVRILQPSAVTGDWQYPSLDGRCDRLEVALLEPPTGGDAASAENALSKVLRMDAVGGVLLRVFAEPAPGLSESDWLNRPGTTFFTRGDQAVYDVPAGRIVMSAQPGRQPQLLLNLVDPGSTPRRQRLRADRFVLNTNTVPRRWFFDGQLDSSTLQPGEPFDFVD